MEKNLPENNSTGSCVLSLFNATLNAELSFGDLEKASREHRTRMSGMLDTIQTNFVEHCDFLASVTQITRSRALVTLIDKASGNPLTFILHRSDPDRMMTILDFVWAIFMERWSERVRETFYDTEFQGFCAQMVRYTEGAEYDDSCEVRMDDE